MYKLSKSSEKVSKLINLEKNPREHEVKFREAYNRVSFYKDLLAHDINNILQNINSSCELISIYSDNQSKAKKINELSDIIRNRLFLGLKPVRI